MVTSNITRSTLYDNGMLLVYCQGNLAKAEVQECQQLEVMKRAVLLTNEKPQHDVCPSSGDNWCKFKNSGS
jgi:hypothetical protein